MPFDAKVIRVLIASPGDVGEERNVIPEIINDWNAINSVSSKIVLMPIKWETHSAPLMGDRPQAIINQQLVEDCDILIGVFWTRIGTNTGIAVSGTAEEIELFVNKKKPVMLYFSQSPIEPDKLDLSQFTNLKAFKDKMRIQGLTESYSGIPDFRQKFSRQLGINVSNLINATFIDTSTQQDDKKQNTAKKQNSKVELPSVSPVKLTKEALTSDKVDEYVIKAVQSSANPSGWSRLASVGIYLNTYTPVDYRDFGCAKLKDFLESRKLFEFNKEKGHPILRILQK